jgi:pyrimidine-nucleoside phosphorylase
VAACGVIVPKMSGRGLGHTGGTVDKLESIPGFQVSADIGAFKQMMREVGTAIVGQSPALAPADKKLYALRDVTGTVESIPLISSSIMSKKLAEGSTALVLDVKCGDGAFMKTETAARELARSLVDIGARAGLRTEALITRMEAPLGAAVGNAVEIVECVEVLKGRGRPDLTGLALTIATRMLIMSDRYDSTSAAAAVRKMIESGQALDKLRQMLTRQGADARVVDDYSLLPRAAHRVPVNAARKGYITALGAELIGRASSALGAGRAQAGDPIDHAAGVTIRRFVGDAVEAGEPVLELHYNDERLLADAMALAGQAIAISDTMPPIRPLLIDICTAS